LLGVRDPEELLVLGYAPEPAQTVLSVDLQHLAGILGNQVRPQARLPELLKVWIGMEEGPR
jgi:hypothetical protein